MVMSLVTSESTCGIAAKAFFSGTPDCRFPLSWRDLARICDGWPQTARTVSRFLERNAWVPAIFVPVAAGRQKRLAEFLYMAWHDAILSFAGKRCAFRRCQGPSSDRSIATAHRAGRVRVSVRWLCAPAP